MLLTAKRLVSKIKRKIFYFTLYNPYLFKFNVFFSTELSPQKLGDVIIPGGNITPSGEGSAGRLSVSLPPATNATRLPQDGKAPWYRGSRFTCIPCNRQFTAQVKPYCGKKEPLSEFWLKRRSFGYRHRGWVVCFKLRNPLFYSSKKKYIRLPHFKPLKPLIFPTKKAWTFLVIER